MRDTDQKVVAIDGPSASGKSSVAKQLAHHLGFYYVDSGAFYRALTLYALEAEVETDHPDAITGWLPHVELTSVPQGGDITVQINGKKPADDALRSDRVREHVSKVSAVPAVRELVTTRLRESAAMGPLAVEGRDIGTAVFPQTPHKFYLEASEQERARRRYEQQNEEWNVQSEASVQAIRDALQRRDQYDQTRSTDPLRRSDDAVPIDTTDRSLTEVVAVILHELQKQGLSEATL